MQKIAFVCDWLTGMRGGEKCLKAMCEVYPNADIFTLVSFPENFNGEFADHRIFTSFIQRLPGNDRSFRRYLPLFPRAVEAFDLGGYDRVVSFSHCVAKGVRVPAGVPHLCYCHTPMRYAWSMRQQYLQNTGRLKRAAASLVLNRLRRWDAATAGRVDQFIANSANVQQRILNCYRRDSKVIYPPVDVGRFSVSTADEGYYLVMSAFVPYKRLDLAVEAFTRSRRPLVVAGSGPECRHLQQAAGETVRFVISPDDRTVQKLYAGCRALIFPGEEDFGIVPLEAQASGKPVIAFGRGGALETVIDVADAAAPTGLFFYEQSVDALQEALTRFEGLRRQIAAADCRRNAERFDTAVYRAQMRDVIETLTAPEARKSGSLHP